MDRIRKYGTFFGNDEERETAYRVIEVGESKRQKFEGEPEPEEYINNAISTGKYNLVTFVPKSLFEQFRRVANLYFLGISILMMFGTYTDFFDSPLTPWTTLIPLVVVLGLTMGKELVEDLKRHRSDRETNRRPTFVFNPISGQPEEKAWKDVQVGDLLIVHDKEEVPADMVLLTSSEEGGVGYVETSNIDGETNLKIRRPAQNDSGNRVGVSQEDFTNVKLTVHCDHPNRRIHNFNGTLFHTYERHLEEEEDHSSSSSSSHDNAYYKTASFPLGASSLLLRGSTLRNCKWALGFVVYTGRETKLSMNSRETPSKLSSIEKTMNTLIYIIFGAQLLISSISLVCYILFKELYYSDLYYLCYDYEDSPIELYAENCEDEDSTGDVGYFFTFVILYNNFIPISLYVTVEVVNFCQAFFIDSDLHMYYEKDDVPAAARTSNVNGDLGKVEYVFSDKTGTLTQNEMIFRRCAIGETIYGQPLLEDQEGHRSRSSSFGSQEGDSSGSGSLPRRGSFSRRSSFSSLPWTSLSELGLTAEQEYKTHPEDLHASPHFAFLFLLAVCHTVVRTQPDDNDDAQNKKEEKEESGAWDIQAESPDEDALVRGARNVGVSFMDNSPNMAEKTVQLFGELSETMDVLAVLPFDSTRKRMSVVVRRHMDVQDSVTGKTSKQTQIVVLTKGADTMMLPLLTDSEQEEKEENQDSKKKRHHSLEAKMTRILAAFAKEGLRTLVCGYRVMPDTEYESWKEELHQAQIATDQRQEKLWDAYDRVEANLQFAGVTGIEDKLQENVGQSLEMIRNMGIRLWVLTGDKRETAINIGYSSKVLDDSMYLIHIEGDEKEKLKAQIRALVSHFSLLVDTSSSFFHQMVQMLSPFEKKKEEEEKRKKREDQMRNNRIGSDGENHLPEPLLESPLNHSSPSPSSSSSSSSSGSNSSSEDRFVSLSEVSSDHLALIIDGPSLHYILGDKQLEKELLNLACICKCVIACRVSPSQKRLLVRLVKRGISPRPITLAIGDGANDVGMIQEAQIGVGISGKEGKQAVNNSDFAIAQFQYLTRLLLVHGRWNYRRISKVVLFSFYKNIVLTMILFYYTFFSAFSGQSLYEDLVYSGFNFFVALPIIGFGIFDQDVSDKTLFKVPSLYAIGREEKDMSLSMMFEWLFHAILDSILIFWIVIGSVFENDALFYSSSNEGNEGKVDGLFVVGLITYTMMIFATMYRAASSTYSWTSIIWLFWLGSLLLYYGFIFGYTVVLDFSYDFYYVAFQMVEDVYSWLALLLIPTAVLMIELCRVWYKLLHPLSYTSDDTTNNATAGASEKEEFTTNSDALLTHALFYDREQERKQKERKEGEGEEEERDSTRRLLASQEEEEEERRRREEGGGEEGEEDFLTQTFRRVSSSKYYADEGLIHSLMASISPVSVEGMHIEHRDDEEEDSADRKKGEGEEEVLPYRSSFSYDHVENESWIASQRYQPHIRPSSLSQRPDSALSNTAIYQVPEGEKEGKEGKEEEEEEEEENEDGISDSLV